MEKLFCLPKISIREMEGRVKEQRSTVKRYDFQTECMQNRINHNSEIKITSPFYLRCQQKEKCECQFHRAKKQQIHNKKTYKSRLRIQEGNGIDKTIIEKYSPRKTVEKENECGDRYRNSITIERTNNLSPIKLFEVLPSIIPFKEAPSNKPNLIFHPSSNKRPSLSLQKITIRKNYKSPQSKPFQSSYFGEDVGCKINDINLDFIKLISSRFQNEKYKQKYLKTLFGFIKYKTNYDKSYLYDSRAYLQNSLNMLLNHYTMDKLLDSQELKEEDLKEIAYYMNCLPSKVQGILTDLAKVVSQMQSKLAEMKKEREDLAQKEKQEDSSTILFNSIIENQKKGTAISLEDQINSINTRNSIMLDLPNLQKTLPTQDSGANFMCKSQIQKYNIRKSNRQINDLLSSSLSKKSGQSSKPNLESPKIRKSRNTSQVIPDFNKSLCSGVLGVVDECQQELQLQKKKSGGKLKKTQKKEKLRLFSMEDKYANVNYEKYMTKNNFKELIGEIERLDLNDSERASTIFKALRIQSQVQDQDKLNDILTIFKPLFNDKSLNHFLKEIVLLKDRRYIEKLERQLDTMLTEIKKNDPRIGGDLDYLQPRLRPERKIHPLLGKIHHCNQYQKERKQPINHIIYYEAEERIQRHLTEQQSSKLLLEQTELKGVTIGSIDPSISKLIDHHNCLVEAPKKYCSFSTLAPTDHKKVLGYMKKHHEGAFNYLAQQFRQLNSYLHSVHQ